MPKSSLLLQLGHCVRCWKLIPAKLQVDMWPFHRLPNCCDHPQAQTGSGTTVQDVDPSNFSGFTTMVLVPAFPPPPSLDSSSSAANCVLNPWQVVSRSCWFASSHFFVESCWFYFSSLFVSSCHLQLTTELVKTLKPASELLPWRPSAVS
jgi:hypothetical protein